MKKTYDGLIAYKINLDTISTDVVIPTGYCEAEVQLQYNGEGCNTCDWQGQIEGVTENIYPVDY